MFQNGHIALVTDVTHDHKKLMKVRQNTVTE